MNKNVNLTAIVAVDKIGGIGRDGTIPWHSKDDMKHFKQFTSNKTCVMGRRTYESIDAFKKNKTGSFLPNRQCVVLTSKPPRTIVKNTQYKDLIFINDLEELKSLIFSGYLGDDVCIMGGSLLYEEFAPYYDLVSMTEINMDAVCDTFVDVNKLKFNRERHNQWKVITLDSHRTGDSQYVCATINTYVSKWVKEFYTQDGKIVKDELYYSLTK